MCQGLGDDLAVDHATLNQGIQVFQIVEMPMTGPNLDLNPVWAVGTVVEPCALGKHVDHALTCFLGPDERSNVVVQPTFTTTDEATRGCVKTDTSRAEVLAATIWSLISPAMCRNATPRMRTKLGMSIAVLGTEADGRMRKPVSQNHRCLPALAARPGSCPTCLECG